MTDQESTRFSSFHQAGTFFLDLVLPPQCLKCGVIVESQGALCVSCWQEANFVAPPVCDACGFMLEYDPGENSLCASCSQDRPVFARARSVLAYDEVSRMLVLSFKNRDRTDAAPAYGRWLARAGAVFLSEADLIVPVPLHWSRLFWRRYNQAALLAQALAQETSLPVFPDLLIRQRRTISQGRLSLSARRRNLRGAFRVRRYRRAKLEGRRILLIDDVLTTGATVTACTRTLLRAGAKAVDVLTLARVMRPLPLGNSRGH